MPTHIGGLLRDKKITLKVLETRDSWFGVTYREDKNEYEGYIRKFCARLYTVALGRDYDAKGLAEWTDKLASGKQTGAEVARGFFFSAEFTNKNLSNEDFLRVVYQTYFDREPDEVGYNNWLSQLNSGTSRKFVVNNGFSNSLEFRNLVASFGL